MEKADPAVLRAPLTRRLKQLALTVAMGVAALNIWTGSPLVALWVGSQVQGSWPPTMFSVFVVVVVFAALSLALIRLLAYLGARHDALTGNAPTVSAHAPWLRSMRGERPLYPGMTATLTGLERVLVAMVVIVVVLFEIWLLLFSTSPIDGRSGRSQVAPANAAAETVAVAARVETQAL